MTEKQATRILVVDDHPVSSRGLTLMIEVEPDMEVCGQASTPSEAVRRFKELKPDMAIVDLRLGQLSGLDLVHDLQKHQSGFPVLVFSMYEDTLYAERAIRAHARGYVMKQEPSDTVIAAIRTVRDGRIYLREGLAPRILGRILKRNSRPGDSPLDALNDRELQVLQSMGDGKSCKEIADELHLSVKTVDGYRASMFHKLDLRNSTELAQFATRYSETGPR